MLRLSLYLIFSQQRRVKFSGLMVRTVLAIICLFVMISSRASAQEDQTSTIPENLTNRSPMRLEMSFGKTSSVAKVNSTEVGTKSSDRFGTLTFHFKSQIFGEVGIGKPTLDQTSINGAALPRQSDTDPTMSIFGIGFRSYRKRSNGQFVGIAFRYLSNAETEEDITSSRSARIFTQKDTVKRYGVVQLSREYGSLGDINRISGKHVWFTNGGLGFGFHWSFGAGRDIESSGVEIDYRTRDAGILIMYRPKLHASRYSYGDEYMDKDFLTETEFTRGNGYEETAESDEDSFDDGDFEGDEFDEDDFDESEFDDADFEDDSFEDDDFSEGDEFSEEDEFGEVEETTSEENPVEDSSFDELEEESLEDDDEFDEEFDSGEWVEG